MPYLEVADYIAKEAESILGKEVIVGIDEDWTTDSISITAYTRWTNFDNVKVVCCIHKIDAGTAIEEIEKTLKVMTPLIVEQISPLLCEPTGEEVENSWQTVSELSKEQNVPRHKIYYDIHKRRNTPQRIFAIKHKGLWRIKR